MITVGLHRTAGRPDTADQVIPRDREWGKSGADELVSGGPERGSGCPSASRESLQDRGFHVLCCHGNLVVVLAVASSRAVAANLPTPMSTAGKRLYVKPDALARDPSKTGDL
jgi:hypothetical protein